MNKNDFLQPVIEDILNKIDFIKKYELISNTYSSRNENFLYSNEEILKIAHDIGWKLKYSKTKEFYSIEKEENFSLKLGFTIRYHSIEIGCSINNEPLKINSSAPWNFWVDLMTDGKKKIKKPMFSGYGDIRNILTGVFSIYKDFKKEVINILEEERRLIFKTNEGVKEKEIQIYKNIDFYNRYEKLSNDFSFENTFEDYSNDEVLKIIENLSYKAKYRKRDNFFQIVQKTDKYEFYFHICLKYGLAELIIGASRIISNEFLAGSVFMGMAKDMESLIGRESEGFIPKPRFRNYEDLKEILKIAFGIYEDFKKEVIKEFG